MSKNLFISHSSYDKKVVELLANLIRKVSLNQIHIWFSSDQEAEGGFLAGDNWFETILNNLRNSQAVVSLITPNSNNNLWILYESGYAEALKTTKLIPLKFLINISEVSVPLQRKQIWGFTNVEEANSFLKKVLDSFDIVYDEEAFGNYVINTLNEMRNCFKNKEDVIEKKPYELLSKKIDNYFDMILKAGSFGNIKNQTEYEVAFDFGDNIIEYIKINPSVRVSDVLDSVYCILDEKVQPYKYLETWIIREKGAKRYVVISDVQNLILAMDVFRPGTEWIVEFLDKPYKPDNTYNAKHNEVKIESFTSYK